MIKYRNKLLELACLSLENTDSKIIPIYIKNGIVVYSKVNNDYLKAIVYD